MEFFFHLSNCWAALEAMPSRWYPTRQRMAAQQLQTLCEQETNFCRVKPLRFQSVVVNYPDQHLEWNITIIKTFKVYGISSQARGMAIHDMQWQKVEYSWASNNLESRLWADWICKSKAGVHKLFCKELDNTLFHFTDHIVSFATTQVYRCSAKTTTIDNM